jgi:hypothetical protein
MHVQPETRLTVEDSLGLIREERDIAAHQLDPCGERTCLIADLLEWRYDLAVLLNEHTVFKSVGGLDDQLGVQCQCSVSSVHFPQAVKEGSQQRAAV